MPLTDQTIVICSTARLVRGITLREQLLQQAAGYQQWQATKVYTLQQWLDEQVGNALLTGDIASDALPTTVLSEVTEAYLWSEAISTCLAKHEATALFDIRSLAKSAIEANQLMYDWRLDESDINHDYISQETRQFLRWRHTFQALCEKQDAIDTAGKTKRQIDLITQLLQAQRLNLPSYIELAGFDRITPLEQSLLDSLKAAGVQIQRANMGMEQEASIQNYALTDYQTECRAAVAWAKAKLQQNPQARLAIVSPILGNMRRELADLLDDTFHPNTLQPDQYEAARCYDFSIGLALSEYPMMHSALQLLRFVLTKPAIDYETTAAVLLDVYWGDIAELNCKAEFDAYLRQRLNASYSLEQLITRLQHFLTENNTRLDTLTTHLNLLQDFRLQTQQRQLLSYWLDAFVRLLDAVNWAKTRSISSHEYQQKNAFSKCITALKASDKIFGAMTASEALQKLTEICANTMFQPEATGSLNIQLLGLLETPGLQQDAVWIMNMNDQHWPPAVRLNPLLPADLQRSRGTPNASAGVQSTFANLVHQRWLKSAAEVVFSYALKEQDRELRPSPLLDIPVSETLATPAIVNTLAEKLSQPVRMQMLEDYMAPPVIDTEQVRGGVKLFATQAICPAWAFYQYRLGARKLETPIDGLDNMSRGSLLHKVLQYFWLGCEDSDRLKAMSENERETAIERAVERSIDDLSHETGFSLPGQVLRIERQRLKLLMQYWLALETERADFSVQACEKKITLNIEGLQLQLTIDRIDELAEGGLVVIDYKTGSAVTHKSWGDDRIAEPQLPIYAALALKGEQVVGVCFGKVRTDETKIIGLAESEALLPDVGTLEKTRINNFKRFESWDALIAHWEHSLISIAREIRSGLASVTYVNESDLEYCDVKPLLRLPERQVQFEKAQFEQLQSSVASGGGST